MELEATSPQSSPQNSGGSRGKLPAADGRSWQALFRKRLRVALLGHLGGKATATQACILDAASEIALELEVMKRRRDERGGLSSHDAQHFLAYQNTYRRHLLALGLQGASVARTPTLTELLAASPSKRADAA